MILTYSKSDIKKTFTSIRMSTKLKELCVDHNFSNWIYAIVLAHTHTYNYAINNHAFAQYPVPDQFTESAGAEITVYQDSDGTLKIV